MDSGITEISNVLLFPGVRDGQALGLVRHASVWVRDGRFIYAGAEENAPSMKADRMINGGGMLLMPALVNAHAHSAMTLLRGTGADLPLKSWLYDVIFPLEARLTARAAKTGIELAMMEYLRCGVTCVNDMYMFPEQTALTMGKAGMRAMISNACVEFGRGKEQLENALLFFRDHHKSFDGRIRASVSVHAEYTSTPELVGQLVRACDGLDNVAHVHLSETEHEVRECYGRHGKSPVRYFHDLGLFSMPAIAAHCVAVDDEDLRILSDDGVTVALNPVSNLKLGSGVAPVNAMLSHGIRIALGTDGAASNDNLDMFEEIKLTGILDKGIHHDPTLIPPARVFEAATLSGAKAMGFDDLGLILEGWQADCVLLDLDMPNLLPRADIPSALVYAARGENVRMTMAQGSVLYTDGEYLTINGERVRREAKEAAEELRGPLD